MVQKRSHYDSEGPTEADEPAPRTRKRQISVQDDETSDAPAAHNGVYRFKTQQMAEVIYGVVLDDQKKEYCTEWKLTLF